MMAIRVDGCAQTLVRCALALAVVCGFSADDRQAWAQATDAAPPVRSLDSYMREMAIAGGSARSIGDLAVGVASACDIQTWQFALKPDWGGRAVQIQRSPTLQTQQARCIYAVVAGSRFAISNPKERP